MPRSTDSSHRFRPATLAQARVLRDDQAPAEEQLWERLRNRQLNGLKFRRQVPIGRYVADFVCREQKLVIELDGDTHVGNEERDCLREVDIAAAGYRVVRFVNAEVYRDVDDVLIRIASECRAT